MTSNRRLGVALRERGEKEGFASPAAIAAIRLLMLTGCRSGEILSLRWDYVDLDMGELRLPGAKVVHLGDPAISVLRGIPRTEGNPWVLPGLKPDKHIAYLHDSWRRILDRAGIENLRIHDLRHRCATSFRLVTSKSRITCCFNDLYYIFFNSLKPPHFQFGITW